MTVGTMTLAMLCLLATVAGFKSKMKRAGYNVRLASGLKLIWQSGNKWNQRYYGTGYIYSCSWNFCEGGIKVSPTERSKTLIIVAHRLTTIRNCDVIYEIKDGVAVRREKAEVLAGI